MLFAQATLDWLDFSGE